MIQKRGGTSPYQRSHQAAVDAARQQALSTYQTALAKAKGKSTGTAPSASTVANFPASTASPASTTSSTSSASSSADSAPSTRPTAGSAPADLDIPPEELPKPQTSSPSALKDEPISDQAVKAGWREYHSAWQNYYQKYYNEYYSQAAQNYLETEKLKDARIASGEKRRKHRAKMLVPIIIVAIIILVLAFLEYNRLIFAPIMAYVSPDVNSVSTSIEAIDPNVTQAVSPEPRLIIPKLNIDVPVAFGIHYSEVMSAMNHGVAQFKIAGANAMPGQVGNLVISGHSAGDLYSSNPYKFIFAGLERLEPGDLIYINYESVRYTYKMTHNEVVEPTNVDALIYPTDKPILTLITCTPLGTSRYRLLVTAEQISPATGTEAEEEPTGDDTELTLPSDEPEDSDLVMPSNEPSFFERIWSNLFGA